jgi:hypothetical protein
VKGLALGRDHEGVHEVIAELNRPMGILHQPELAGEPSKEFRGVSSRVLIHASNFFKLKNGPCHKSDATYSIFKHTDNQH